MASEEVMMSSSNEIDARFPSGKWLGFWTQTVPIQAKPQQEMWLTFRDGVIQGEGRDLVGKFLVCGTYSTSDGRCFWTKRYVGQHDVFYQGFNEGKGIWGTWEIRGAITLKGGFHIWPEGLPDPTGSTLSEEADLPLKALAEVG
jgi:hypothetical protein